MTKRILAYTILISLVMLCSCSKADTAVQSAKNDGKVTGTKVLSDFKKEEGVKQIQGDVIVDLPSQKDKQAIVDSIDPKTGGPAKDLQAKAGDKIVQRKHLIVEDTGKTLDMPYVSDGNKDVIIYDPVMTLWTIAIPGTNDYFVAFDRTIYKIDWKNSILKKFLKDEVNGYKKDEVLSCHLQGVVPVWAESPYLNPSGTYLLFFSNRSIMKDNFNGEMWVKNLHTGDERPILPYGAPLVGWVDDRTAIMGGTQILSLDMGTGAIKALIDSNVDTAIIKGQLVYQTIPGSFELMSINTGEKAVVSSKLVNRVGSYQTRGSWAAMLNQVKDGETGWTIVLYNVDTEVLKVIEAPDNMWIDGCLWQDDSTLLVRTSIKGTQDESTYFVNINELPEVQ